MCRACGDGWRFEATELATGRVKAVLHPIGADWEEALSQPTTASLLLATRDPAQDDVWATETGLYISRVIGPDERDGYWGGYIEDFGGAGRGSTTVAAVSVDEYLFHRLLADESGGLRLRISQVVPAYVGAPPAGISILRPVDTDSTHDVLVYNTPGFYTTSVAHTLVKMAEPRGIPLTPNIVYTPEQLAGETFPEIWNETGFNWWEFKNIGVAIREMVEASPGLKYWLTHHYEDGYWSSVIHFSDEIGTLRDYTLRSDYEGWQYGLKVDGKDKASRVYGLGSGNEADTLFSVAYDAAQRAPEFQSTVSWKDQTNPDIVTSLTAGYVSDHRDPVSIPSMTLVGLPNSEDPATGYPPSELLQPGDRFKVDIGYGVITVKGILVKCLGVSWKLQIGSPIERVISMLPIIRPADSIRTQTPARQPGSTQPLAPEQQSGAQTVDPWPKPGLVTKIHPNILHEISGTQISYANPGHIWVHNDNEAGDLGVMYLVDIREGSKTQGEIAGRFNVKKMAATSDYEGIRMFPGNPTLYIGDIGDNGNVRPCGFLHKLTEPVGGGDKGLLPTETVQLTYPFSGGWLNTETLMLAPDGQVITITKESGKARVVTFGVHPSGAVLGNHFATLPDIDFVVDGTYTLDGRFVLLRTNHNDATFVYETGTWKRVGKIKTPPMPKGEGITVESNCSFLVTTEAQPHAPIKETETPVYRVLIPREFGATCGSSSGSSGGTPGTPPAPGPSGPAVPANILDLTNWKLTLPVN